MDPEVIYNILDLLERVERLEKIESPIVTTGSWTPAFTGTGVAGTFTYVNQIGRYTRISNQVVIHASIQISAITVAPTVNMTITGLPIASANVANLNYSLTFGYIDNFNYTNTAFDLTAAVAPNTTVINLYESFDNAAIAAVPAANFTNANCWLMLSGVYQI